MERAGEDGMWTGWRVFYGSANLLGLWWDSACFNKGILRWSTRFFVAMPARYLRSSTRLESEWPQNSGIPTISVFVVANRCFLFVYAGLLINDFFLYALLLAYATARPTQSNRAEATFLRVIRLGHVQVNRHLETVLCRAIGRSRAKTILAHSQCMVNSSTIKVHDTRWI